MKIQFQPSILKFVTLPFTILILILYLWAEVYFFVKCNCSFIGYLERTGKTEVALWKLGEIWACQIFFIYLVFSARHTISDDSITGYNDWLRKRTIRFSEIKDVKIGFLRLTVKLIDKNGFSLSIFSYQLAKPQYSWVREKLGLGGRT